MALGKALGMEVIAWTFHPSEDRSKNLGIEFVALNVLMRQADVISLHLPLIPQSRGIIGRHELSLMKPTGILVNTARGAIVDEEALVEVLQTKRIYGTALDVFAVEPLPEGHPLIALDNVVLSPHRGAATKEAEQYGLLMTAKNVENWLRGKPTNVVV